MKKFKDTRNANAITKTKAQELEFARFLRQENFVLFFSVRSIYKIDLVNKTCTCRFFLAYCSCQHKHRAFELFDIQDASVKFVFRAKKGPKARKIQNGQSTSKVVNSIFTSIQSIELDTHLNSYYQMLYANLSLGLINEFQYDMLPVCLRILKLII